MLHDSIECFFSQSKPPQNHSPKMSFLLISLSNGDQLFFLGYVLRSRQRHWSVALITPFIISSSSYPATFASFIYCIKEIQVILSFWPASPILTFTLNSFLIKTVLFRRLFSYRLTSSSGLTSISTSQFLTRAHFKRELYLEYHSIHLSHLYLLNFIIIDTFL